jgi:Protein of unknown function (DUF4038)/Putative collagen-binding domain of a collagenase
MHRGWHVHRVALQRSKDRARIPSSLVIAFAAVTLLALGATAVRPQGNRADAGVVEVEPPVRLPAAATRGFTYPLKVSRNRRYLVDQRNQPFFITGDSPQALIGKLSLEDAAAFIANRRAAGFNSLLVDLLCEKYTGCRDDGSTYDGIKPFTTPGDLSTPNPVYFARADAMIRLMTRAGMVVFLDPIETGGWLETLRRNRVAKAYAYGRFVGARYRRVRNIVWWNGNDFQTWSKPVDDAVVLAVAKGIRSVDRSHPQTVLLDYFESGSLDDARWRSVVQLDAAYSYYPTYARVVKEYNRKNFVPVFMAEAGYELEAVNNSVSFGDPDILRRQEYWSLLSGAAGQMYGNGYTWQFKDEWKSHVDTPGSAQVGYLVRLFAARPWFRLVPDQGHKLVTAGFGTFKTTGKVASSDYVTTASTRDGKLAISYLPSGGTITVDVARLAGPVRAQWYDPAKGVYSAVPGSPFPRSAGKARFTAPGKNADGDPDWVLVLTVR